MLFIYLIIYVGVCDPKNINLWLKPWYPIGSHSDLELNSV